VLWLTQIGAARPGAWSLVYFRPRDLGESPQYTNWHIPLSLSQNLSNAAILACAAAYGCTRYRCWGKYAICGDSCDVKMRKLTHPVPNFHWLIVGRPPAWTDRLTDCTVPVDSSSRSLTASISSVSLAGSRPPVLRRSSLQLKHGLPVAERGHCGAGRLAAEER